jgi:broad specificity phosphatase PhoE
MATGTNPRFPTPDFLFATADSPASKRPRQTITPTAAALGLCIDDRYGNKQQDIDELGQLLWTARYAGKTILICWHHGTMRELAAALRATGATKWHGAAFDRVWCIDYQRGAAIQQYGQQLLFGDQANVPETPW